MRFPCRQWISIWMLFVFDYHHDKWSDRVMQIFNFFPFRSLLFWNVYIHSFIVQIVWSIDLIFMITFSHTCISKTTMRTQSTLLIVMLYIDTKSGKRIRSLNSPEKETSDLLVHRSFHTWSFTSMAYSEQTITTSTAAAYLQDFRSEPCQVCGENASGWHCGSITW